MPEHLQYDDKEMSLDIKARHLRRTMQAIELYGQTGGRWLNYGCGHWINSALLSQFCDSLDVYDRDTQAALASQFLPNVGRFSMDAQYDAIFCIEVIEHNTRGEAIAMLDVLQANLANNGKIILSTPVVPEPDNEPLDPNHKHEFSYMELLELFSTFSMKVEKSLAYPYTSHLGEEKNQGIFLLGREI